MTIPDTFTAFDIAVAVIVLLAAIFGFASGTLKSIAGLITVLLSALLAVAFAPIIEPYFTSIVTSDNWRHIGAHLILFIIALIIIGLVLRLLVSAIAPKPTLGDSLAGLIIGFLRGALLALLFVMMIDAFPIGDPPSWLSAAWSKPYLSNVGKQIRDNVPASFWEMVSNLQRTVRRD